MATALLSDAADSKLVRIGELTSPKAMRELLRLRMHMLLCLITRRPLLVTEGWALDSMVFIRVAAEVARAIRELSTAGGQRLAGIETFSPILMETRRPGNYFDVFAHYAGRDDIRWSGFSLKAADDTFRLGVREAVADAQSAGGNGVASLTLSFKQLLGRTDIPEDLGSVADYFLSLPQARSRFVVPPPDAFQQHFGTVLGRLAREVSDTPLTQAARRTLAEGRSFRTSSLAMAYIDGLGDAEVEETLNRAVNYAYLRVTGDAQNAALSTPAFKAGTSAEQELETALTAEAGAAPTYFSVELAEDADLVAFAASLDWVAIWKAVISLVNSPQWDRRIAELAAEVQVRPHIDLITESSAFRAIVKDLEAQVPNLVLRRSASDRFGLGLKPESTWSKLAYKAPQALAGAALIKFGMADLWWLYLLINVSIAQLDPLKRILDISSPVAIGAKRASLLGLYRRVGR